MIHAHHVIFGTYGFWLPNDPRGSWSDFVAAWELLRFGNATKGLKRFQLTPEQESLREEARHSLKRMPVSLSGPQARAVGNGFANAVRKSNLTVWRCSILPEHIHLVIARHTYKVEYIAGLLKGEATKQLRTEKLHPFLGLEKDNVIPTPWSSRSWKVYLDNDEAITNAIHYVDQNPIKEGKPRQIWRFETPYRGLEPGWIKYH